MDKEKLMLFTEELLPLMRKYGYRGLVGFSVGENGRPAVFDLTVAGEPKGVYQAMRAYVTRVLSILTGKSPIESGEINFLPKKSDNTEMPY